MSARFGLHTAELGIDPIRSYSRHLAKLARNVDGQTPVPTCGDWAVDDLVRHLIEVQDFWAWIIEHRPNGPERYTEPPRSNAGDLADALDASTDRLVSQLEAAPREDQAWSWHPEIKSVEFSWRRQSHEALIHCFDAVLATESPWPDVSAALAADGFDELATVVAGGVADWARYRASDDRLLVTTDDSGDSWNLEFGSITGRSPRGTDYKDEPTLFVVDATKRSTATLRGTALAVNLWAWGRTPDDDLVIEGDRSLVSRLRALIAESTQ